MLNPRVLKERNNDESKQDKEDESYYDEKLGGDQKDEESNAENDGNHEMHELAEINNDTGEANNMADEETNVRKSSRVRKQRMIINDDEIGDCDDEKDPDYIR